MNGLTLGTHRLGVRLEVRATPRASRNAIDGVRDGRLVVKVTAPPVDSAANVAVIDTVSRALGLAKRDVTIVAGEQSRSKSLALSGITAESVRSRLSVILGHSV
jgi:uncharacterized protein (TIGR00251 family)